MGFLGIGAKTFGGNTPRNAMTADLCRLVKKLWRCSKYPSLYARQRNYKQELSYRKQIARQLHTQYVKGIHRPKYYTTHSLLRLTS